MRLRKKSWVFRLHKKYDGIKEPNRLFIAILLTSPIYFVQYYSLSLVGLSMSWFIVLVMTRVLYLNKALP